MSAETLEVIRLGSENVREFLALRREALAGEPAHFRYSVADDENISEETWRARLEDGFVVAASTSGKLAGVAGFTRMTGEKLSHKGLIWGMYVRPESRGGNTADRLMEALLTHARTCVQIVQLTVMAHNVRAKAFYKRHGFIEYATEPRAVRIGDELLDESLMWLPVEHGKDRNSIERSGREQSGR